jgi:hypothetical protein
MRRILHPGYGLILLVAVAGFFTYLRLDKQGFYRHYFRVIAEVAERNSQEVPQAVLSLGTEKPELPPAPDTQGAALQAGAGKAPQLAQAEMPRPAAPGSRQQALFAGLPPVRAP